MFLDLNLPGLTGGQVLGRLQEYERRPPVVLITGYADTPLMDQALDYELLYVLAKPFSRNDIKHLLETASVRLPQNVTGDRYLIVVTDSRNVLIASWE